MRAATSQSGRSNLSSGEETQLTFPPDGTEDLNAAWSFDGEWILFTRLGSGVPSVWVLPTLGDEPTVVLDGEPIFGQAAWFPDNERIVVPSVRSGTFNLWELRIGTGAMTRLTAGAGYDWSPVVARDGSIAYTQFEHQIDLHWVNVDDPEAEHERLSNYTGQQFGARVSQDGQFVAYYCRPGRHVRPVAPGPEHGPAPSVDRGPHQQRPAV